MANNKNNKNTVVTNNSIIDTVYNNLSSLEVVEKAKTRNSQIDNNYFMTSLDYYYLNGSTIPAYTDSQGIEHGEAILEKNKLSKTDIATLVDRHKGTISKQIKAMKYIIENGYFKDFYTGKYRFHFDKINLIFDDSNKKLLDAYTLDSLLDLSCKALKAVTVSKEEEEEEEEATEEAQEEATTEELATLIYDGKEYSVNKSIFEKWLAENGTLVTK